MLADRIHAYTHGLDEAVAAAVEQAAARVPALADADRRGRPGIGDLGGRPRTGCRC